MTGKDLLEGKKVRLPERVEIKMCEYFRCKNPSIGKYTVIQPDEYEGEIKKTLRLCQFHVELARNNGSVTKA